MKAATSFVDPKPEWVQAINETRAQAGAWVGKVSETLAYYSIVSRLPLIKATATLLLYGEADRLRVAEDILYHNIVGARKGRAARPGPSAAGRRPPAVRRGPAPLPAKLTATARSSNPAAFQGRRHDRPQGSASLAHQSENRLRRCWPADIIFIIRKYDSNHCYSDSLR